MYARIARFEGDPSRMDESIDAARKPVEADCSRPRRRCVGATRP